MKIYVHHQFNFTIPLSMYIHVWRLLSPELKYPLERSFIQFHEYHLLSAIIEQRIPRILTRLIRARLPSHRCKLLNISVPFAEAQLLAYNYSICTRRAAFQAWTWFQRESSKVLLKKRIIILKYVGRWFKE